PPGARRFLVRAAPLRTTGGAVIVMHDVTEMRRLERMRRDFVANVSHELRTPVSVILANSETLLDGVPGAKARAAGFLGAIHRNADRLSRIIADLLELSRIEAGEYRLEVQSTELGPIVAKVVESLRAPANAKQQELGADVPDELCVQADSRAV